MNSSSTLLDSCICRRFNLWHLSWHLSRHLYLSSFTDLLYKGSARFPSHFYRSLSRQIHPFTSQKTLFHSKPLSKCFLCFFKFFPSFGKFIFSHFHAFHVLKPRFWGFWKILGFLKNFGIFQNWWVFKISYIASHKHYNSIIMHFDVCKLIMCW